MTAPGAPRFTGQVAIVTGAARNIGLAIARRFATEGAHLVLADIDGPGVRTAADTVGQESDGTIVAVAADLATSEGAAEVARTAVETFGRLDVLVNNAGGGVLLPALDHTEETLRATIERNLWTTLRCSLAVLPVMVGRSYGRIVNIGAESVRSGLYDHAVYNAAKGGVHGLTTGLAREFAAHGITVNAVAPGIVATGAFPVAARHPEHAGRIERILATIPMGRPAALDEVGSAVAYLAGPEAGYITGQVISVNGGSSML